VGLERGSLSLVNSTKELLERKSSGCGLENRLYSIMLAGISSHSTSAVCISSVVVKAAETREQHIL
jgi:hypothetical protein